MGIKQSWRLPALIWLISVSLIYSTTLIGDYLVGTDLHLEYYFANQTLNNGWDASVPHAYNGALSVTILAPFLSKLLSIDLYTVFKVVFPFIYSFTPVVLYYLYRRFVSDSKAFWAAIFFVIVPTFFIEVTGIAREQIAELFLAMTLLAMVSKRWILFAIFGILTVLSHYSVGYVLAIFIVCYAVAYAVLTRKINWRLVVSITLILSAGYLYLSNVADGIPLKSAEYVGASYISPIEHPQGLDTNYSTKPGIWQYFDISNRDSLVKTALGLDFFDVPIEGKIFRVLQLGIQVLVVFGLYQSWRNKQYQVLALCAGGIAILSACVVIPGFAGILNPSRFYHLAMFSLSLVIVMNKFKWLPVLALAYLIFTSGLVFEALKLQPGSVNIPYSITASHQRLDLGTNYTEDDVICAEWLDKQNEPVYADVYGLLIIQETLGLKPLYLISDNMTGLVFLRSYNEQSQEITIWRGAGIREYVSYSEYPEIYNAEVVFTSGDSKVVRINAGDLVR